MVWNIRKLVFVLLVLSTSRAMAAEFIGRAEVLSAEPILKTTHKSVMPAECQSGKPTVDDLNILLQWDLGVGFCEEMRSNETAITGYAVRYRWQDQVYKQVTTENPGSYLPIRVKVD